MSVRHSHHQSSSVSPDAPDPRRWRALVLLAVAQFVVVLDASIMNIALPSISQDLGVPTEDLSWIINGYVLTFGGFLLLGGRLADLLGRRRIFVAGLVLFAAASLAGGLAATQTQLVIARAVQGLGGAMLAPAALSLLTTLFPPGPERNKALGVWGAVAGSGAAAGVLLGGVITDALSWEWVLFINLPIGVVTAALAFRLISESRAPMSGGFDLAGAAAVTGGLSAAVYAIVEAESAGWGSTRTIGFFALAAILLAVFVVVERRTPAPLVPFDIFRKRTVLGANVAMLIVGAAMFGLFFFLSIYMQQVLGYSALETGVAQLPLAGTIVLAAGVVSPLVTRFGSKPVLLVGLVLFAAGMGWFARIPADGSFVADLLGPSLLVGLGLAATFIALTVTSVEGVAAEQYGLASGLINTTQQIGGALGLAILAAVANSRTSGLLESGTDQLTALTEGFQAGLLVAAGFAVAAIPLVALLAGGTPARTAGNERVASAPAPQPADA